MARRSFRRRGPGMRFRKPRPNYAWWRSGPVAAPGLSGATLESSAIVLDVDSILPTPTQDLDWSRKAHPIIERIILQIVVSLTNALARAVIRYIWGVRLQELGGASELPATSNSLTMADNEDRREDWLYRSSIHGVSGATAAEVILLGDADSGQIQADFKPRRPMPSNTALVFQNHWSIAGGGAPDMTPAVLLDWQILFRMPNR